MKENLTTGRLALQCTDPNTRTDSDFHLTDEGYNEEEIFEWTNSTDNRDVSQRLTIRIAAGTKNHAHRRDSRTEPHIYSFFFGRVVW